MVKEEQEYLYLSKDKEYLADRDGNFIFNRNVKDNRVFYQPLGSEASACDKVTSLKVCVTRGVHQGCDIWDDVDVCANWEPGAEDYNNIS